MKPGDPVVDLVERTLSNLQTIDNLAADSTATDKTFEVTQMVNSLLSLLVVPQELRTVDFVGRAGVSPQIRADGIGKWRWGSVKFELRAIDGKPPEHLKKLLTGLRNSVAHANFEFIGDSQGSISELEFTSCGRGGSPRRWSVRFKVAELRNFLVNLGEELIAARQRQNSAPKNVTKNLEVQTTDLEITLPTSTVERIKELVTAGEAESVPHFIHESVAAKLRDDEDVAAA